MADVLALQEVLSGQQRGMERAVVKCVEQAGRQEWEECRGDVWCSEIFVYIIT